MKKLNRYIAAIALLFFLVSCEKELNTAPTNSVADSEVYRTADNIETVLNGTWRYLNDTYFTFANPGYTAFLRASDAMGSDVAILTTRYGSRDTYPFNDIRDRSTTRVRAFWTMLYKTIDNANNVVANVDASEGTGEKKRQLKGQALALRAFCYLNLVSYYQFNIAVDPNAPAVPLYTDPTTVETEPKGRATVGEIYAQMEVDLQEALANLEGYSRSETQKYKINRQVVHGLLARLYLNSQQWESAAQHAQAAREGFALMDENAYKAGFNDLQNVEWIWGHGQTTDQSTASYTFHYLDVSSPASFYYSFRPDPYFMEFFDEQDYRRSLFSWDGLPGREGLARYDKFRFRSNLTGDIVYMRASEMQLIEAEAYARLGQEQLALERLNGLLSARNALTVDLSGGELLAGVLLERRKELWGEGFSLWDILRTQGQVERRAYTTADGDPVRVDVSTPDGSTRNVIAQGHTVLAFPDGTPFVPNSPFYLFEIPQDEYNNNPNL